MATSSLRLLCQLLRAGGGAKRLVAEPPAMAGPSRLIDAMTRVHALGIDPLHEWDLLWIAEEVPCCGVTLSPVAE